MNTKFPPNQKKRKRDMEWRRKNPTTRTPYKRIVTHVQLRGWRGEARTFESVVRKRKGWEKQGQKKFYKGREEDEWAAKANGGRHIEGAEDNKCQHNDLVVAKRPDRSTIVDKIFIATFDNSRVSKVSSQAETSRYILRKWEINIIKKRIIFSKISIANL